MLVNCFWTKYTNERKDGMLKCEELINNYVNDDSHVIMLLIIMFVMQ